MLAVGGVLASTAPAAAISDGWRTHMLAKVNEARALTGAAPVRRCAALTRSAQAYADTIASTGSVAHTGPDGSVLSQRMAAAGYRATSYGENLAAGQPTVLEAIRGWRGSPSHYATMTLPRFRHVGFGYATSPDGARTYWVQHYGDGGRCR